MKATPTYKNIHNRFKLNNTHFNFNELKEVVYSLIKEGEPFEQEIGNFLLDWQDGKSYITLQTSGSTGKPKAIKIDKQAMVNSAIATGDYFNLKPGNRALLCLPATYIAGKMMLVRAMILGLELDVVAPRTKLDFNTNKKYHFSAMVPMQLQANLKNLDKIKQLIVGGAAVSNQLKTQLTSLKTKVFETYGMTETVSHIAVKQLNNLESSLNYFIALPEVEISTDERGCLVINAQKITSEKIITNDVVKLHGNYNFEWLGRFDTIINSGGIKLLPEQIEAKLKAKLPMRFFIASEEHKTLGQALILIIESEENTLKSSVFNELEAFEKPKNIYCISRFSETNSGKIQRNRTLQLLKK